MARAEVITSDIKKHDSKLFCRENREGKLCIYREGTRIERYDIGDNVLINVRAAPSLVCAITHNWKESGYSVDWGLEPIRKHLRDCDLWVRDIASDLEKQDEKAKETNERKLRNDSEAFFSENHSKFKDALSDINTSNMSKKDRKRDKDKSIKGY